MEPHIGDKLAHDTSCCKVTMIVRIIRQVSDFHFIVIDSDGDIHLCIEAARQIEADFYVDHLAEVTSRFGFYSICEDWQQNPY